MQSTGIVRRMDDLGRVVIPKEIIGAIMSDEMRLLLEKRKVFIACKLDGILPIKIYRGDENFYDNQIVVPIICNGDVYGALVVYDRDKSKRFSSFDEKVVCLGGDFISSQFDV